MVMKLGVVSHSGSSSRWTGSTAVNNADLEKGLREQPKANSAPGQPLSAIRKADSVSSQKQRKSARPQINHLARLWSHLKRRIGTATAPSSTSIVEHSVAESQFSRRQDGLGTRAATNKEEVDEVVVDREWNDAGTKSSIAPSDTGDNQKSGSHPHNGTSVQDSLVTQVLWYRSWPVILYFFDSKFMDPDFERHFQQEEWFSSKHLALWSSVWFIINWVLAVAFVSKPWSVLDQIFYYAVCPALTVPIGIMVLYNIPRDHPVVWQSFLAISIWSWSTYYTLSIYLCGFYNPSHSFFTCGHKDFLGYFYYATALQPIALMSLRMRRFPAALGALVTFVLSCVLIVPARHNWFRLMINFFFYHAFLIYVHYMMESSARRLFCMRSQLKKQYTATQKAQVNERKASDSKRRLTSYVFHEVRVPLNTALLAVQNMSAYMESSKDTSTSEMAKLILKDQEIEFNALVGSLSMMSKVLNDVLDFNRMDSGKFESVSRPYPFHQVMRSLFVPLRLATDARGLELITDLDENIDKVARRAAYAALGESEDSIQKHMETHPNVDGIVTGDETRLRQIITNLASNGCKFTKAGGKLIIKTRLVLPAPHRHHEMVSEDKEGDEYHDCRSSIHEQHSDGTTLGASPSGLSKSLVENHNMGEDIKQPGRDWIVVRIEVTDTGHGIAASELAEGKLFSAFNQTEQGRQQGGKGTGLGLALVRQIVKLSGGRLGLKSKPGVGSTFWVELPLGVGVRALGPKDRVADESSITDISKRVGWAKDSMDDQVTTTDTLMVLDAMALKATRVSPTDARSESALHGLMEHGGRVELTLSKTESLSSTTIPTPHALADSMVIQQQQSATPTGSIRSGSRISLCRPALDNRMSSEHTAVERPPSIFNNTTTMTDPPISPPNPPPPLNVLVVDDDPLTRMLMKRLLTRVGCQVFTAENGQIALDIMLGTTSTPGSDGSQSSGPILDSSHTASSSHDGCPTHYAIVFLDNQMPVMSGISVVAQLRSLGRDDFVVGVTGNALISDQEEYIAAGVDKVLTKPVLESQLKEVLNIARERLTKDSSS